MSYSVESKELFANLQKLGKKYTRAENKAVNESLDHVEKSLKENTPRWNGKKYEDYTRGSYTKEHMEDHTTQNRARGGYGEVGFDDNVGWRAHFVEFGTIKQRPQGFVQRTEKEVSREVKRIIERNLKGALGL